MKRRESGIRAKTISNDATTMTPCMEHVFPVGLVMVDY